MRNGFFVFGIMLALLIADDAWAMQPTMATWLVTGRVTAVGASGRTVTIETNSADECHAVTPGDQVHILAASAQGAPPVKNSTSRRLLGVWLLGTTGAFMVLRARRPRVF